MNTSTWLLNVGGDQLQVRSLLLFFCQLCMTCLAKQVIPALLKCPDALSLAGLCWNAQMHFHLQHQSCLDCGDCAKRGLIFLSIKHRCCRTVNWLLSLTMSDGSGSHCSNFRNLINSPWIFPLPWKPPKCRNRRDWVVSPTGIVTATVSTVAKNELAPVWCLPELVHPQLTLVLIVSLIMFYDVCCQENIVCGWDTSCRPTIHLYDAI